MAKATKKRFQWTNENRVQVLEYMIDHHGDFLRAKKNALVHDFYSAVGDHIGTAGDVVENMLKNIGKEYRDALKEQQASGAATDDMNPGLKLKDSRELFDLFDSYYRLFYPKGGAARPAVIVTATGVRRPGHEISSCSSSRPQTPVIDSGRMNPGDRCSTGSETTLSPPTSRPETPVTLQDRPVPGPSAGSKRLRSPSPTHSTAAKKPRKESDFMCSSAQYQEQSVELMGEIKDLLKELVSEIRLLRYVIAENQNRVTIVEQIPGAVLEDTE